MSTDTKNKLNNTHKTMQRVAHTFLVGVLIMFSLSIHGYAQEQTPPIPDTPAQLLLNKKLTQAAIDEKFDHVKRLINKGARAMVKQPWKDNHTALSAALASGFGDIGRYILEHDESEPTDRALFYAARLGDKAILQTLLKRIPEKKLSNSSWQYTGHCPLTEAVRHGRIEAVKLLFPIQKEDCFGLIPKALEEGHLNVAKWLVAQQSAEQRDRLSSQEQWMELAMRSGRVDIIKYVQTLGIPLEKSSFEQYASDAAYFGHLSILKYLRDQGAKFDDIPSKYSKVLFSAVHTSQMEVIDYLLEQGVSINKPGVCYPPLMHIAAVGKESVFNKFYKLDTPRVDPCNGQNPLHAAVSKSVIADKNYLLYVDSDWVKQRDSSGNTPLNYIVHNQWAKQIYDLIIGKSVVDNQNNLGQTALMTALAQDSSYYARKLLNQAVEVNLQDNTGSTALHYLARSIDDWREDIPYLIKRLKEKGAGINIQDRSGLTPLALLIKGAYPESKAEHLAIKQLLSLGADPSIADAKGQTAFDHAKQREDKLSMKLLGMPVTEEEQTADIPDNETTAKIIPPIDITKYPDQENNRALHGAVRLRSLRAVQMLLKQNVKLDEPNQHGDTALQLAIKLGEYRLVNVLIRAGASIHTKNRDGRTPLHTAIAHQRYDIAAKLLESKADVNALTRGDWTPLHFAAQKGHQPLIEDLLARGADPKAITWGDETPEMLAKKAKHDKAVELLTQAQRVVSKQGIDRYGNTPLIRAVQALDVDVVKQLLSAGKHWLNRSNVYYETPLQLAIWGIYRDKEAAQTIFTLLLDAGADIHTRNRQGTTPLHFAIREAQVPTDMVATLIKQGAKVDTWDAHKEQAIHAASRFGKTDVIQWILEQQPELISRRNKKQQTLLHLAVLNRNLAMAQLLIQKGVDVNAKDDQGITPAYYTLQTNHPEMLQSIVTALKSAGGDLMYHPPEKSTLLMVAARLKQNDNIHILLDNGYKLNEQRESTAYELMKALVEPSNENVALVEKVIKQYDLFKQARYKKDHERMVHLILMRDVDRLLPVVEQQGVNLKNESWLKYAIKVDAIKSFKWLARLSSITDFNQADVDGNTLLHHAVDSRSEVIVKWLSQQKGIDINARNRSNQTPLDQLNIVPNYFDAKNDKEFAATLLDLWPNAHYEPNLLKRVMDQGRFEVALLLAQQRDFPVKAQSRELLNSLLDNLSRGNERDTVFAKPLLVFLLDKGAKVPPVLKDDEWASPLLKLVKHPELFRILLKHRQDPISSIEQLLVLKGLLDNQDETSLELIAHLANEEWDLTQVSEKGEGLLHHLAGVHYFKHGDGAVIKRQYELVLNAQQDKNLLDKEGHSPLHLMMNNPSLFKHVPELFDLQAAFVDQHPKPILPVSKYGYSALTNESALKRFLAVPVLQDALVQRGLHELVKKAESMQDLMFTFPLLVQAGADPKGFDEEGNTLAHHWLKSWDCELVYEPNDVSKCLKGLSYLRNQGVDFTVLNHKHVSMLHLAMDISHNLPIINFLLKAGVSPDAKLENGNTPLHLAVAKSGSQSSRHLQALLRAGADVNVQNEAGNTPLHLALESKNNSAILFLLQTGKVTNIANKQGRTPLHELVTTRRPDWVKRLLHGVAGDSKAVNQVDAQGNNALHLLALQPCKGDACKTQLAIAEQLLAAGIDPAATNQNQETAFLRTAYHGNLTLAKWLHVKYPDAINQLNSMGNAPVHIAYQKGHVEWMDEWLIRGVDWTLKNWEGNSMQKWMDDQFDMRLLKLAMTLPLDQFDWKPSLAWLDENRGAELSTDFYFKMLDEERLSVAELLIPHHEGVVYRHHASNDTFLHIAARHNSASIINKLLEQKHPVNWVNKSHETALHLAARHGSHELIQTLLQNGADPNIQNRNDLSPFHIIARKGDMVAAKSMLKAGAKLELSDSKKRTALLIAVESGDLEFVQWLIDKGADIKAKDEKQQTPLIHAIWTYVTQLKSDPTELKNRLALIDLLLANGATLDEHDELKRTPLHIGMPIYELAQHLLQKGSDPNARNTLDETPFIQAIRTRYPVSDKGVAFIRALVGAGANINERNKQQVTPLHLALSNNRMDLLPVLIELGADVNIRIRGIPLVTHLVTHNRLNNDKKKTLLTQLLKSGVELNVHDAKQGIQGKTPLHHAIAKGNADLAQFLMVQGSNPSLLDELGLNALHTLANLKQEVFDKAMINQLLPLMVKAGLDINAVDYDNRTALHHAARENHKALVDALLVRGVDANAQSTGDDTALMLALDRLRVNTKDDHIVKALAAVTDVNRRDRYGRTVLHYAYEMGNIVLAEWLVSQGADEGVRDYYRRLPAELVVD